MSDAYQNALRTIADAYDAEHARWGGKSLSRVATIVASSGAFFIRLRDGKTFSVANLDRFATWFRQPINWPNSVIPHAAEAALISIGRPPSDARNVTHSCTTVAAEVASDCVALSDTDAA